MADCSKTKVFLAEWNRMCKYYRHCESCDANEGGCLCIKTPNNIINNIEKAQNIVQKWSDAHPAPKPKTHADDFFEKFPNCDKDIRHNNIPALCRVRVYGGDCKSDAIRPRDAECETCWNDRMRR